MKLKESVKGRLISDARAKLQRAQELHGRLAVDGAWAHGPGFRRLINADRRDVATFIFFEVAAHYESFCHDAFTLEVRKKFAVEPGRAQYLLGSADKGAANIMGWGAPDVIVGRAQNLFGRKGFFSSLELAVGNVVYQRLGYAHKVRNRIAHSGGSAMRAYRAILGGLGIPASARKGLGVGRLLMDYPANAATNDRWFARFLAAYAAVINGFDVTFRV